MPTRMRPWPRPVRLPRSRRKVEGWPMVLRQEMKQMMVANKCPTTSSLRLKACPRHSRRRLVPPPRRRGTLQDCPTASQRSPSAEGRALRSLPRKKDDRVRRARARVKTPSCATSVARRSDSWPEPIGIKALQTCHSFAAQTAREGRQRWLDSRLGDLSGHQSDQQTLLPR